MRVNDDIRNYYGSSRSPIELQSHLAVYRRTRLIAAIGVLPVIFLLMDRIEHANVAVTIGVTLALTVLVHTRLRRGASLLEMSILDTSLFMAMTITLDIPEVVPMIVTAQAYIIFFFVPAKTALSTTAVYLAAGLACTAAAINFDLQQRTPDETITIIAIVALLTVGPVAYSFFHAGVEMHRLREHEQKLRNEKDELLAELKETLADLSNTQAELLNAQKLEAIGSLAAGIAHEINTPIQYVSDNTRFVSESLPELIEIARIAGALTELESGDAKFDDVLAECRTASAATDLGFLSDELPDALTESLDGIDQVARLVNALKSFAHPGTTDKSPADINELITATVAVSRNEWKYVADVDLSGLEEELPQLPVLAGPLKQVLLNLVVNAAHAIAPIHEQAGAKGTISITTTASDEWGVIEVSDTGTGIPLEVQDRIFEPFFTTKEVGKGSGQGLAIANSIVEKHDGELTFVTEPGEGTTFSIRLPRKKVAVPAS